MTTAAPVTHLEKTRGVGIEDYSKQLPCDPQFTGLTTTFRPQILQAFGIALRRGGKRNSELGGGGRCFGKFSRNLSHAAVHRTVVTPQACVLLTTLVCLKMIESGRGHAKHMQTHSNTN